jgi:hypothetical protein
MLHVSWPPVRGGEGRGYYVLRSNRSERERGAEMKYSGGLSQRERELRHPFGRCSPTAHWAAPPPSPATIARSTRQQETERERHQINSSSCLGYSLMLYRSMIATSSSPVGKRPVCKRLNSSFPSTKISKAPVVSILFPRLFNRNKTPERERVRTEGAVSARTKGCHSIIFHVDVKLWLLNSQC